MNIRYYFVIFLCISSVCTNGLLANEHLPKAPYLDFKCTTWPHDPVFVYDVTASPGLAMTDGSMALVVNIGNSQVRFPVIEILQKGVELRVENSTPPRQEPSDHDCVFPGLSFTMLRQFTLRVGDSDVVSWTRYNNGKPTYVLRNFRVYLVSENDPRGHYWITERFSKEARDNLFAANVFSVNAVLQTMPMSLEDQIRLSVSDPVWIMLTTQRGFIYPNRLIFPIVDELIDQEPIATAKSVGEYVGSQEPVWKLPFLLPPLIEIKPGIDRDQAVRGLKALQRDVTLTVIKSGGAAFSSDRLDSNEKLLKYYLEIIDESSPLHDRIEANLTTVREEAKSGVSGFFVGGTNLNTGIMRSAPVRKQQAIPAEPVERDGSGR